MKVAHDDFSARGFFRYASFYTGFTKTCDMCGTETVLIAMLEDSEWVADTILETPRLSGVVAIDRNRWSASTEIGGRLPPKRLVDIAETGGRHQRNTHHRN